MRLIDADKLFERFFEMWGTEVDVWIVDMFMETVNAAPTIAPPPNDPLTLDELREMEGEPIWIGFIHTPSKSRYRIIRSISNTAIIFQEYSKDFNRHYSLFLGFYGRDWLAYCRKPEEV